jgi:hypothetical protein
MGILSSRQGQDNSNGEHGSTPCPLCSEPARPAKGRGRLAVFHCRSCGLYFGVTLDSREADGGRKGGEL